MSSEREFLWPLSYLLVRFRNPNIVFGEIRRAHYFAHYKLAKVTYDAGGLKEFYEIELGSQFPPFRSWPTSFEIDFFTRIANQPQVKLYLTEGLPIYMECNF